MSISVMEQPSRSAVGVPDPGDPHLDGVVSANLRVLRAAGGERTCLVMVKVGSASAYLPIDEARQAVTDAHDLPRQIQAAIAIADQVAQGSAQDERQRSDGAAVAVLDPAGDADDGVISGFTGRSAASNSVEGRKVSLPRRLCRSVGFLR